MKKLNIAKDIDSMERENYPWKGKIIQQEVWNLRC